jgi:hypothetical protein
MSSDTSYIKRQLVFMASVPAAGTTITKQYGPGLLTITDTLTPIAGGSQGTGGVVGAHGTVGKYVIMLPVGYNVPNDHVNLATGSPGHRRMILLTANSSAAGAAAAKLEYDDANSTDNGVIIYANAAAAAADCAFYIEIYRIEMLP